MSMSGNTAVEVVEVGYLNGSDGNVAIVRAGNTYYVGYNLHRTSSVEEIWDRASTPSTPPKALKRQRGFLTGTSEPLRLQDNKKTYINKGGLSVALFLSALVFDAVARVW